MLLQSDEGDSSARMFTLYVSQEEVDLDVSVDKGLQKLIDTRGAGVSVTSPNWLTQLGRLWGGRSVCAGQWRASCSLLHQEPKCNRPS